MLFNNYYFIFWFFPIVLFLYHFALGQGHIQTAKWIMLASSLAFYAMWKLNFLPIFLAIILFSYIVGITLKSTSIRNNKIRLILIWVGACGNLAFLFYFKYLIFFVEQLNFLFDAGFTINKVIMPLGISFFTFMQISFLFECYHKREKGTISLLDYTQFITFFPHLIAGPIILSKELIPQFNDLSRMRTIPSNISVGLFLFALGLFKKVVIADNLAENSALPFDQGSYDGIRTWIGVISYTLQLYFDFSGYMDMAMGIARMMNFEMPINFDSPFRATNISLFWQRWHITMTRFFMTYVFTPLAIQIGRKHINTTVGKNRRFFEATAIPIFVTFILAGIWHGAGWTFVIFGMWHGLGLVFHRLWLQRGLKIPKALAWLLTALFVIIGFVFFRSPNIQVAVKILDGMISISGDPAELSRLKICIFALILAILPKNSNQLAKSFKPNFIHFAWTLIAIIMSLALIDRQIEFLYWQF